MSRKGKSIEKENRGWRERNGRVTTNDTRLLLGNLLGCDKNVL